MSDTKEIRQRRGACDRIVMWNVVHMFEEHMSSTIRNNENEEIVNTVEDTSAKIVRV